MRPLSLALAASLAAFVASCASAGDEQPDANPGADAAATADATGSPPDGAAGPADAIAADAALDTTDAMTTDAMTTDAMTTDGTPAGDGGISGDVCLAAAAQPDNDGCGAAIDLTTAALTAEGATVAGDTTGYADNLHPPSACTGGFYLDGPDAAYTVTASAGQTITAQVAPVTYDTAIYILSSCAAADIDTSCLVGADANLSGEAEAVSHSAAVTGTYYIIVDGWNPGIEGCYTLQVTVN